MPHPTAIAQAILDTILYPITQLFLAVTAGDESLARQAAIDMIAAYHAETEEELTLAAEIVCFRLQSLEALAQSAQPDLSLNKILRLRGGAVSLSREAHKSQRKLDQLQKARRAAPLQQPAAPQPPTPEPAKTQAQPQAQPHHQPEPRLTWSQTYQKRQRAQRQPEKAKKQQTAHPNPTPPAGHSAPIAA